MSALVLLNLSNKLWKRDKMQGLQRLLLLFSNKFNTFKNTGIHVLGFIYHMTLNFFEIQFFGMKMLRFCHICVTLLWTAIQKVSNFVNH